MTEKRWWDAAMVTVSGLLVALTVLLDQPADAAEWGLAATLAVVLAAYFCWGRRSLSAGGSVPALLYAALLLLSLAVGIGFDPSYSFMQAVIYPSLWALARGTRQAVVLNLLAVIPVAVGYALHFGMSGLLGGLGAGVLAVGFSLAIGSWITSVERASAERARLLDELLAVQDELAAVNREAGVDSERARLSREIHDTIAQSLTGLVMVAQRAHADLEQAADAERPATAEHLVRATADVELIETMARDALTEARGLVAAIAPVRVESTLAEALGRLAERFERETGIGVRVELREPDAPAPSASLPAAPSPSPDGGGGRVGAVRSPELDVVLLRCAQEALANVRKHAAASSASVAIAHTDHAVTLCVTDDGVGPGPLGGNTVGDAAGTVGSGAAAARGARGAGGFGLAGMADRVALVGGSVRFEPALPRGSRLTVTVPSAPCPPPSAVHTVAQA